MELAVVQGLFFCAARTTRKGVLCMFFSPWAILIFIAIPQFAHSPEEVLLILLVPVFGFALNLFVEQTLHYGADA